MRILPRSLFSMLYKKVRVFKIANICKEMIFFSSAMKGFVHQHYQHHRPETEWVKSIRVGLFIHIALTLYVRGIKRALFRSRGHIWRAWMVYGMCSKDLLDTAAYNIMKWGGWCWYASSMPCFHCWEELPLYSHTYTKVPCMIFASAPYGKQWLLKAMSWKWICCWAVP